MLHGDAPLQHRVDALAHSPGRVRLDVPDRRQDRQHVGAAHLGNGPASDAREDVVLEALEPVGRLSGAAPAGPLLLDHGRGGLGEGGHALGAALVGEGVAAGAGELAVGEGLLAGIGERDELDAAESELVFPAADDEALDPASGSGTLDVEVESVAVGMPADWRGADEGSGECVVWMSAPGLGCAGLGRVRCHTIHSPIIYEMLADFTRRVDPESLAGRVISDY